ncbi:hypothetical protein GCM10027061_23730 [Nesterenkonia suensis]
MARVGARVESRSVEAAACPVLAVLPVEEQPIRGDLAVLCDVPRQCRGAGMTNLGPLRYAERCFTSSDPEASCL